MVAACPPPTLSCTRQAVLFSLHPAIHPLQGQPCCLWAAQAVCACTRLVLEERPEADANDGLHTQRQRAAITEGRPGAEAEHMIRRVQEQQETRILMPLPQSQRASHPPPVSDPSITRLPSHPHPPRAGPARPPARPPTHPNPP